MKAVDKTPFPLKVRVLQLGLRPPDPDPRVGRIAHRPLRRRHPLHGRLLHHEHWLADGLGRSRQAHNQRAHHGLSVVGVKSPCDFRSSATLCYSDN